MKQHMMIGMMLWGMSAGLYAQPVLITKLFHHKVPNRNDSLEMGTVSLYVTHKPSISVTTKMDGASKQSIYFMPGVRLQSDQKAVVERIERDTDQPYRVHIQEVTIPQQGLQITLTYNPKNIGISYELFDSITLQKGVVFRLLNKQIISRLQLAGKPIIKTASNIPRVVIDCGHGGTDRGAVGCNRLVEKDVNLQIGLQVAQLLKDNKVTVDLVRQDDRTCLLDERTTFANQRDAHLLVSIHSNAAVDVSNSGIETYCLAPTLFERGDTTLAPAEDAVVSKQLQGKYTQSRTLADAVHRALLQSIRIYQTVDRSIKQSVAQVLLGTTVPAVLIELGFLTHQKEATLLAQKQYQSLLARGIVTGILSYLASM